MGRMGSEGLLSGGVQMRRGFVSRLGRRVSEVDYVEIAGYEGKPGGVDGWTSYGMSIWLREAGDV
jgi:hypothetical protein